MIGEVAGPVAAPWAASLSEAQYQITAFVLGVAVLAFLAGMVRSLTTTGEVGSRYRPAISARMGILVVAFVSYVGLLVAFFLSYHEVGDRWEPGSVGIYLSTLRSVEWSVTVPLLCLELLAVCGLVGRKARRYGILAIAFAFAMIVSGFAGDLQTRSGGSDGSAPSISGLGLVAGEVIGSFFWAALVVVLVRAVVVSRATLTYASWRLLVRANALLLMSFVLYPLVYAIPLVASGGGASTVMQVVFTAADVTVKLVFGSVVLRVAKLRTAEDVRAGDDVHPESIWISLEKVSDAGLASEVHLAEGASVHPRREEQPIGSAVPLPAAVRPSAEPDDPRY